MCKILHIGTCTSIKFLSRPYVCIPPTGKVQRARYSTFAHMQLSSSYQDLNSTSPPTRTYCFITPYTQGAKWKILQICADVSIKFLSRPYICINPYMQGAKCKNLHIRTHVCIKFLSRPYFFTTPYMQGAQCKILHNCTHASIKFLSRPYLCITPYLQGAKGKILHICTWSSYQDPNFYITP